MKTITLKSGKVVSREDYIDAKFLDLRESYSSLMRDDVSDQLDRIEGDRTGLTVIGVFMLDDIP